MSIESAELKTIIIVLERDYLFIQNFFSNPLFFPTLFNFIANGWDRVGRYQH